MGGYLDCTAENADDVRAEIVFEGANGPTTPEIDDILANGGVLLLATLNGDRTFTATIGQRTRLLKRRLLLWLQPSKSLMRQPELIKLIYV